VSIQEEEDASGTSTGGHVGAAVSRESSPPREERYSLRPREGASAAATMEDFSQVRMKEILKVCACVCVCVCV